MGAPDHQESSTSQKRRRRKVHSTPAAISWLRDGPPGQLLELVTLPLRRCPLGFTFAAASLLWFSWPWLRPTIFSTSGNAKNLPDVVAVSIEDFRRTITALNIWKTRPRALLVLMAPGRDAQSISLVRNAALTQEQLLRVVIIDTCGDTVTEMADLSRWLGTLPKPGQLLLVSSPAHIQRMTAIGKVMQGGAGWEVDGVGSLTSEQKPESPLRLIRDQFRSQIWRATGWTGKKQLICPGRARNLF